MVYQNKKHPEYSLDMEILAFISKTPARLQMIAEDLDHTDQELVRSSIDRLKKQYQIKTGKAKEQPGIHVWCSEDGWPDIREASSAYMESVYGQ